MPLEHDPLRPTTLDDFAGQPSVKQQLATILAGARFRGSEGKVELPPHLLLTGPPGLGKTTLAQIVANEFALTLKPVLGPTLENPNDLVNILVRLPRNSVLFIDEIHRLPTTVEESLYTALEDNKVDLIIGKGTTAQAMTMRVPPFVLIGATTRVGDLSGPLRDRFGYTAKLKPYDTGTLSSIVTRSAGLLEVELEDGAADLIAGRGRGTPRIANRLLKRVRDYANSQDTTVITTDLAQAGLAIFGIDHLGLTELDREVLTVLCTKFATHPVGLDSLASSVGESSSTVQSVCEPYLIDQGLMVRTTRGRVALRAAYEHLHLPAPEHLLAAPTVPGLTMGTGPAPALPAPEHQELAESDQLPMIP